VLPDRLHDLPVAVAQLTSPPDAHTLTSTLHVVLDASHLGHSAELRSASAAVPGLVRSGASGAWPPQAYRANVASKITEVLGTCSATLQKRGIACVSFLCVTPLSAVFRLGFRLQSECNSAVDSARRGDTFVSDDMLSHVEPPTAAILETTVLPAVSMYVPSHAHQLHSFLVQVRALGIMLCRPVPGDVIQHSKLVNSSMRGAPSSVRAQVMLRL
jgi:hypothetical protein